MFQFIYLVKLNCGAIIYDQTVSFVTNSQKVSAAIVSK